MQHKILIFRIRFPLRISISNLESPVAHPRAVVKAKRIAIDRAEEERAALVEATTSRMHLSETHLIAS